MSGRGIKHMANGDVYDGEWRGDKAHGWGIKHFANGDRHEGHLYFKLVTVLFGITLFFFFLALQENIAVICAKDAGPTPGPMATLTKEIGTTESSRVLALTGKCRKKDRLMH
jgi:hypothetical protein